MVGCPGSESAKTPTLVNIPTMSVFLMVAACSIRIITVISFSYRCFSSSTWSTELEYYLREIFFFADRVQKTAKIKIRKDFVPDIN